MQVKKPTILLNKERVMNNIKKMVEKAKKSQVLFRPHFKTHQSADIGEWFKELGVSAIAVSSVDMAEYFAEHGWKDITITFVLNIRQIDEINKLAEKITLNLLVDSQEAVTFLKENIKSKVNIWIKTDTDYHRTGIHWDNEPLLSTVIRDIKNSENLNFVGLLTYSGKTYKSKSKINIEDIYEDTVLKLINIQERLFLQGFAHVKISVGDTPSCSIIDDFTGVDEIHPGNFVFYDVMQLSLGSCKEEDIAIAVACPIVAKYLERKTVVIYGGAIHLSKDYLEKEDGTKYYGLVALQEGKGWGKTLENTFVASVSQEHGLISTTEDILEKLEIGDLLYILPIHSCLTSNLLRKYITLEGNEINFNSKI